MVLVEVIHNTQLAKVRSMTLYTLCTADYRINLEEKDEFGLTY